MHETKKVTEQIFRNITKGVKIVIFRLRGSETGPGGSPWSVSMGSSYLWLIDDILWKVYA